MRTTIRRTSTVILLAIGAAACSTSVTGPAAEGTAPAFASGSGGGGGGGTVQVDQIKVSKCYWSGGQMLINASSSDPTAQLFAYKPDGSLIGAVQNGGGSRYGGTVMPYTPIDPVYVTIRSSSGGSTTVPTTPFQI